MKNDHAEKSIQWRNKAAAIILAVDLLALLGFAMVAGISSSQNGIFYHDKNIIYLAVELYSNLIPKINLVAILLLLLISWRERKLSKFVACVLGMCILMILSAFVIQVVLGR